jgi:hypothetical protein
VRKEQLQQQAEATVAKREALLAQIAALKEVRTAQPGCLLLACLLACLLARLCLQPIFTVCAYNF